MSHLSYGSPQLLNNDTFSLEQKEPFFLHASASPTRPPRPPRSSSWSLVHTLLPLGAQHLDDRLEGEPLGDLLARAQHLPELRARELLEREALLLGLVGGHVVGLLGVHEVERGDRLD